MQVSQQTVIDLRFFATKISAKIWRQWQQICHILFADWINLHGMIAKSEQLMTESKICEIFKIFFSFTNV